MLLNAIALLLLTYTILINYCETNVIKIRIQRYTHSHLHLMMRVNVCNKEANMIGFKAECILEITTVYSAVVSIYF